MQNWGYNVSFSQSNHGIISNTVFETHLHRYHHRVLFKPRFRFSLTQPCLVLLRSKRQLAVVTAAVEVGGQILTAEVTAVAVELVFGGGGMRHPSDVIKTPRGVPHGYIFPT
jgi:hypothetical protein